MVEAVVLWEPIMSGASYLESLGLPGKADRRYGKRLRSRPAEVGGRHEFQGFPVTPVLADGLMSIDLVACIPALPADTLILTSGRASHNSVLRTSIEGRGDNSPVIELCDDCPIWVERTSNVGSTPLATLDRIVRWLDMTFKGRSKD